VNRVDVEVSFRGNTFSLSVPDLSVVQQRDVYNDIDGVQSGEVEYDRRVQRQGDALKVTLRLETRSENRGFCGATWGIKVSKDE
jgi:hypothetical protein